MGTPRVRNAISRYDYPDDRLDLHRWASCPGPTSKPYWLLCPDSGDLVIELTRSGRRMSLHLSWSQLRYARPGWRRLVAEAVREIRWTLRRQGELL